MSIRPEVWPFILAASLFFGVLAILMCRQAVTRKKRIFVLVVLELLAVGYFLYFFRDPVRTAPGDDGLIVAGADGTVAAVTAVMEDKYLKTECVRISIFLSLFDVHVNRAPLAGQSTFLGYFPGRHLFTFQEKSSDVNQHNKILIEGRCTRCLVTQIVGPVCRRVVYWPDHDKPVQLAQGDKIGMMKFGSRLDMYLPKSDVEVTVAPGEKVRAGETVVARMVACESKLSGEPRH